MSPREGKDTIKDEEQARSKWSSGLAAWSQRIWKSLLRSPSKRVRFLRCSWISTSRLTNPLSFQGIPSPSYMRPPEQCHAHRKEKNETTNARKHQMATTRWKSKLHKSDLQCSPWYQYLDSPVHPVHFSLAWKYLWQFWKVGEFLFRVRCATHAKIKWLYRFQFNSWWRPAPQAMEQSALSLLLYEVNEIRIS